VLPGINIINSNIFLAGIPPEGCSSVHFERIMGKKNAERMLGKEGWTPTAAEAKEAGFVMEVVKHEQLMQRAQEIAEKWVKEGKVRNLIEKGQVEEQQISC
jgi:enoyl-CoA hydratase/carnithine racemase